MPSASHTAEARRPSDAELLKDDAWHYLINAATDAEEAASRLRTLASDYRHRGLTPDQFQQLDNLSDVARHVAIQSRRMLAEITS